MNGYGGFSPVGYSALVTAFLTAGYEVRSFAECRPDTRHVILRHDVDFSLEAACSMAELEAELGVSATYFVLLRTEFYNPMSYIGWKQIERIASYGHTIGLHFDAALYREKDELIEKFIAEECTILEMLLKRPVTVLSFHRPAKEWIGGADTVAGRFNAYGLRFVKSMGYCSDSRGAWHYGHPLDHLAVCEGRALQLLTHPFWWQAPEMAPKERLKEFISGRRQLLDSELAHHCMVYR